MRRERVVEAAVGVGVRARAEHVSELGRVECRGAAGRGVGGGRGFCLGRRRVEGAGRGLGRRPVRVVALETRSREDGV